LFGFHRNNQTNAVVKASSSVDAIQLFLSNKKLSMHSIDQVGMGKKETESEKVGKNPNGCSHISSME
jgi:hypothetical protein